MSNLEHNNNIETTEVTNETLAKEIKENTDKLAKIDPTNESIKKLQDVSEKFSDNKDALQMILEGVKKINDQVSQIANKGQEELSLITGKLFKELEKIDNSDFNLDTELNNL